MSRSSFALALLAVLACAGCEGDVTGPVRTLAVAWDKDAQHYSLGPVRLSTITSLRHLRGGAGSVQGGGAVQTQQSLITAKGATIEGLRPKLVQSASSDVDVAFDLQNNVAYPANLDSLQLVTAFYNLEQARAAFNTWGLSGLPPARLVLGAEVKDEAGRPALGATEMYLQPLATHFLPVPAATTQLPLAMNQGAMAHSLTHQAAAVFAWSSAPAPTTDQGPAKDPDWNTAKHATRSMTEGLADFIAAAVTQDAHWLDHSNQQQASSRALDSLRCGSAEMLKALPLDDAAVPYDPYPLGTVLAAALWEASQGGQPELVAAGALGSLVKWKAAAAAAGGKLGVADVLEAIVAASDGDERPSLCGLFLDRFAALSVSSLPTCNGVTAAKPTDTCACPPDQPGGCP